MESDLGFYDAKALLDWQVELGATEAIGDTPVNRYALDTSKAKSAAKAPAGGQELQPGPRSLNANQIDPAEAAKAVAGKANTLAELRNAIAGFDLCDLKRGARNLVFSDGDPSARLMIIGEAPGRDEDREGRPFVGRVGQLFDRMLAAIDMGRDGSDGKQPVYVTTVLPWRPPQNRDPNPEEIAMMLPFVARHVALVNPDIVVLMGNISCQAILGRRGITRLRGEWTQGLNKPVLPMFHPTYLMRQPAAKKHAWADLLAVQAKLRELT